MSIGAEAHQEEGRHSLLPTCHTGIQTQQAECQTTTPTLALAVTLTLTPTLNLILNLTQTLNLFVTNTGQHPYIAFHTVRTGGPMPTLLQCKASSGLKPYREAAKHCSRAAPPISSSRPYSSTLHSWGIPAQRNGRHHQQNLHQHMRERIAKGQRGIDHALPLCT